jgi:hypothetical protein
LTETKPVKNRLASLLPAFVLSILSLLGLPTPGRAQAPVIATQPVPQMVYAGRTATFSVAATNGTPPLTYQWRQNGNILTDGGNISGSTNATLTLANIVATNGGSYDVVVTGASGSGSTNSSVASLTVLALPTEPYAAAVLAANPLAFYQFNDPGDPSTNAYAFDYVGGVVGTYGTAVQNGFDSIAGPTGASGFPGFAATNTAAEFFNMQDASQVTVPSWNLTNVNTVTITAWIYPNNNEAGHAYGGIGYLGLVICSSQASSGGLGLAYSGNQDASGNYTLACVWNGNLWDSGLAAPPGQWSFVALVVTPTNTTLSVMNTNGVLTATSAGANAVASFNAPTLIGDNSTDNGQGLWVFDGVIDDVAVFASALSPNQLAGLFSAAPGVSTPVISQQPVPEMLYAGRTATFTVAASGQQPLTYQWRKNGNPLTDSGHISGSTSATLTISNISSTDSANYDVVVTGAGNSGSIDSRVVSLTVLASPTEPYAVAVLAANPLAFYQFNDPGDPSTNAYAFDYVGGGCGNLRHGCPKRVRQHRGPHRRERLSGVCRYQHGRGVFQRAGRLPGDGPVLEPDHQHGDDYGLDLSE